MVNKRSLTSHAEVFFVEGAQLVERRGLGQRDLLVQREGVVRVPARVQQLPERDRCGRGSVVEIVQDEVLDTCLSSNMTQSQSQTKVQTQTTATDTDKAQEQRSRTGLAAGVLLGLLEFAQDTLPHSLEVLCAKPGLAQLLRQQLEHHRQVLPADA